MRLSIPARHATALLSRRYTGVALQQMTPEFWISFLSSTVVSSLLAGAIVFITKNWIAERLKNSIQHEYNSKLESHRAILHANSEAELAKLKAGLEIAATEHEVHFSKLHEERFECMKVLSTKAWQLERALVASVASGKELNERIAEALNELRSCSSYFYEVEIFLPKDFADQWNKTIEDAARAVYEYQAAAALQTRDWKADYERGRASVDTLITAARAIRAELLERGRRLLDKAES
jgi:hypothetical protein